MTTGMRPSEYLALTGADVDLERGTVSVSRTLECYKGGWRFADTKRARSRRVVKFQAWVIALLEKHKPSIETSGESDRAHDLVFSAKRGGPTRESTDFDEIRDDHCLGCGTAPGLTPESYLKSIGQRFKQTGVPMELSGMPEQIAIGGKGFWKGNFTIQAATGSFYESEFVTTDKVYFLQFIVVCPDLLRLREIEKSLESIHFLQSPN
jgi:hypothetical protein